MTELRHPVEVCMWQAWVGPYEGPFTLVAKHVLSNCLESLAMLRPAFGMHPSGAYHYWRHSSLLKPRNESVPWANRFLASHCGGAWATLLCDGSRLRYCPECLALGYHTPAQQLTGLALCPVHRCALTDRCTWCGRETGPYALVSRSFARPLRCAHCNERWTRRRDAQDWDLPEDFVRQAARNFEPLYEWLRVLRGVPVRQGHDVFAAMLDADLPVRLSEPSCELPAATEAPGVEACAMALELAGPPGLDPGLFLPTVQERRYRCVVAPQYVSCATTSDDVWAIFKALRRQVRKRWLRRHRRMQRHWEAQRSVLMPLTLALDQWAYVLGTGAFPACDDVSCAPPNEHRPWHASLHRRLGARRRELAVGRPAAVVAHFMLFVLHDISRRMEEHLHTLQQLGQRSIESVSLPLTAAADAPGRVRDEEDHDMESTRLVPRQVVVRRVLARPSSRATQARGGGLRGPDRRGLLDLNALFEEGEDEEDLAQSHPVGTSLTIDQVPVLSVEERARMARMSWSRCFPPNEDLTTIGARAASFVRSGLQGGRPGLYVLLDMGSIRRLADLEARPLFEGFNAGANLSKLSVGRTKPGENDAR